jgi:uncharacterized protein
MEEVLVKQPRLRVYPMHAGYPLLDDPLALLYAHAQVRRRWRDSSSLPGMPPVGRTVGCSTLRRPVFIEEEIRMATNGDIIRGVYDAFGRGDVPAVLGAFDPAIEWREAEGFLYADRNPYIGPQAVAGGVFQRIVSDVAGFALGVERITEGGDTVLAEGRYRGKMNATGTPVDAQFAHVWQLRDGRIVRFQQYTDTRQWAAAAGV